MLKVPEAVRQAVANIWAHRSATEREAHVRFARLAGRLAGIGAHDAVVALARQAAIDEQRHEQICRETSVAFGADAHPRTSQVDAPEVAPARLSIRDRVLYEAIAFCAISESMNVTLLTVTLEHATDTTIRKTAHEILKDEVNHSRIGWAHLAWERERRSCAFLGALLPRMLRGSMHEDSFRPFAPPTNLAVGLAHGVLPVSMRAAIFKQTLTDVILPGLEAHDVPTEAARKWISETLPKFQYPAG